MTRINIVEPSELTDQHLIAEYREIFMVAGSLRRTLVSKSGYQENASVKNMLSCQERDTIRIRKESIMMSNTIT